LSVFDYVESTLEPNPVVEYSSLKKVSVSGGSEGEVLENTKKTRDGYGAWSCPMMLLLLRGLWTK
jgi:hypothetical protein